MTNLLSDLKESDVGRTVKFKPQWATKPIVAKILEVADGKRVDWDVLISDDTPELPMMTYATHHAIVKLEYERNGKTLSHWFLGTPEYEILELI